MNPEKAEHIQFRISLEGNSQENLKNFDPLILEELFPDVSPFDLHMVPPRKSKINKNKYYDPDLFFTKWGTNRAKELEVNQLFLSIFDQIPSIKKLGYKGINEIEFYTAHNGYYEFKLNVELIQQLIELQKESIPGLSFSTYRYPIIEATIPLGKEQDYYKLRINYHTIATKNRLINDWKIIFKDDNFYVLKDNIPGQLIFSIQQYLDDPQSWNRYLKILKFINMNEEILKNEKTHQLEYRQLNYFSGEIGEDLLQLLSRSNCQLKIILNTN